VKRPQEEEEGSLHVVSAKVFSSHLVPDVIHPQVVAVEVAVLACVEAKALAGRLAELRGSSAAHLLSNSSSRAQQDASRPGAHRDSMAGLRQDQGRDSIGSSVRSRA